MSLPCSRTLWEEGREPGREMVVLGLALALTAACLDLLVTARVGVLFDLGYVLACLALALAVRRADFFSVGVLPPLLMLVTFVLLALSRAEALVAPGASLAGAVVGGLAQHWVALLLAHTVCLAVLATRVRVETLRAAMAPLAPQVRRTDPGRRLPA